MSRDRLWHELGYGMNRWWITIVGLLVAAPAAAQTKDHAQEPLAAKLSLVKSAEFLDGVSLQWTEQRKCGSCHTNYAYLMARPALGDVPGTAMAKVRGFFEDRVANWDTAKPRWDTEVVATGVALAVNDAHTTAQLHPLTRQALDRMWKLQRPDGAWNWLKCDWPPMEHDDYFGAVYAAVGVGIAPEKYAETPSAKPGVQKLLGYLQQNPPPDLHHAAMLLWAAKRLPSALTPAAREHTIQKLLALQRDDGGWSLPSLGSYRRRDKQKTLNDPDGPSDGYGTGFVVYVLRQAGLPADQPQVRKGAAWLERNQRESGRWFTRSLNTDSYHFISHVGTAYAVMALQECTPKEKP